MRQTHQCPDPGDAAAKAKARPRRRARRGGKGGEGGNAQRANLYEEVTARIIGELEAGRFPWVQPWGPVPGATEGGVAPGLPRHALTARPYSGIHILILWGDVLQPGHSSQSWLTFRQAPGAGRRVRTGERGPPVVFT